MKELLCEVSYGYGKGSHFELSIAEVIEDTPERREEIFDEVNRDSFEEDDLEAFINGEINFIYGSLFGGDWDDPNCIKIELFSYEDKMEELDREYQSRKREIDNLFGKVK